MSTKGFLLLLVTVIAIGGSIGGAFVGGLALGRSQNDDSGSIESLIQERFGGQIPSGGSQGDGFQGGSGQFGGAPSDSPESGGETGSLPRFGEGGFTRPDGSQVTVNTNAFNGTVSNLDGHLLTVTSGENENQVDLSENSSIQKFGVADPEDIAQGDQVLVIASGDLESGGPVDAVSVIVNPPQAGGTFGGGFGGRGGFAGAQIGVLNGSVAGVSDGQITVATESGETVGNLDSNPAIQRYSEGTVED
ncbi:MAG: hypothetical protein H8E48_07970, partial [Chloroflexi bacterium]|nr:hypothetical protein [Chloroflexota bacterium]